MRMQQVLTTAADIAGFYRHEQETPAEGRVGPRESAPKSSSNRAAVCLPTAVDRCGPIFQTYDLENIEPRQLSEMARQLDARGLLAGDDLRHFAGIRVDLEKAGYPPAEPVDLLTFYSWRIESAESALQSLRAAPQEGAPEDQTNADSKADALKKTSVDPRQLTRWRQRAGLLAKLATLHDLPDARGVNVLG